MPHLKDQRGTVPILELVLFVMVIALAWGAIFNYSNSRRSTNVPSLEVARAKPKTTSPMPTTSGTAGWKTYTSAYEQASFMYPPNWALTQKKGLDPSADDYEAILTSPSGLEVNYWDLVSGLGGACGTNPLTFKFSSVQPLTDVDSQGKTLIYLVQSPGGIALTDATAWSNGQAGSLAVGSCGAYVGIASKFHGNEGTITFGTSFFLGNMTPSLTASQAQDIPTAKLILESFRY